MILIVSSASDPHVESVTRHLSEDRYVLLDLEWRNEYSLRFASSGGIEAEIVIGGRTVPIDEITSVWYRRPGQFPTAELEPGFNRFAVSEFDGLFQGLLWVLHRAGVRLYNHPLSNRIAASKPLQMMVAKEIGLEIPETYMGNDSSKAQEFLSDGVMSVIKGISESYTVANDQHYSIFVREVDASTHDHLSDIEFCPATLQQRVDKAFDLRLVVIDGFQVAFRIVARDGADYLDWRELDDEDGRLSYEEHTIPSDLSTRIGEFMTRMNIRFGAFDFSYDSDGKYVFLEVNPNGQWLWLEQVTGKLIGKEIARVLHG